MLKNAGKTYGEEMQGKNYRERIVGKEIQRKKWVKNCRERNRRRKVEKNAEEEIRGERNAGKMKEKFG